MFYDLSHSFYCIHPGGCCHFLECKFWNFENNFRFSFLHRRTKNSIELFDHSSPVIFTKAFFLKPKHTVKNKPKYMIQIDFSLLAKQDWTINSLHFFYFSLFQKYRFFIGLVSLTAKHLSGSQPRWFTAILRNKI